MEKKFVLHWRNNWESIWEFHANLFEKEYRQLREKIFLGKLNTQRFILVAMN